MLKILLLKGLPASGKSTYAKKLCETDWTWRRINKDDIRAKYNESWSGKLEDKVLKEERELGIEYLKQGFNLVVDDSNFHSKHEIFWKEIAQNGPFLFEIKFFDVDIKECIERDSKRENPVGERAIRFMYKQYILPPIKKDDRFFLKQDYGLPHAIIVDMDGTLALMNGRNPFDFMACGKDLINQPLKELLLNWLKPNTNHIIIVSGREDKAMEVTKKWLHDNGILFSYIFMRKSSDYRPDEIIKQEIFENEIKDKFYIEGVFDDRDKVVKMWRDLGLLCLQVYYGDF